MVVVFPTETAYAIGGDALDSLVHQRIARIKCRPGNKPFPWIVASFAMAEKYGVFSPAAKKLAKKYWPGPLTLILPLKSPLPNLAVGQLSNTIAIRVPSHPVARTLSRVIGRPIIATSANLSGKSMCYTIAAVKKQFGDNVLIVNGKDFSSVKIKRLIYYSTLDAESIDSLLRGNDKDGNGNDKEKVDNPIENIKNTPDLYINGGTLPRRKASTIVRVEKDGAITLLREGAIKIEAESAK